MGADSKIAWTDHTFNPWWGCQKTSPGCAHCYAEAWAKRTGHDFAAHRFFGEKHWAEPLAWDRAAERDGKPANVFCASMGDVFEDSPDLAEPRARLWALTTLTPNLRWLLLTKRPENAARMWTQAERDCRNASGGPPGTTWLPSVWLGTTAEDQARADERIPHLLATPAAVRFVSVEPMLGPVDLTRIGDSSCYDDVLGDGEWTNEPDRPPGIDWVICGSESGHHARPMQWAWAASLRDQCAAADVSFFMKQGPDSRGKTSDEPTDWPGAPWPREYPG